METKVTCHVTNCLYNDAELCAKENIRVDCNTPKATGPEAVNCMSFKIEDTQAQF